MAAWEQSGRDGVWYSVSMKRSYQDKSGNWQDSTSFGDRDIPDIMDGLRDFNDWLASVDSGRAQPQTTDGARADRDMPRP